MSMAQEGKEIKVDLEESGRIITGAALSETVYRRESVIISEGALPPLSESPSRSETVIITNE